jgi:8-oxo-dGTP pyrophosphatase MutT (NUDIX family)
MNIHNTTLTIDHAKQLCKNSDTLIKHLGTRLATHLPQTWAYKNIKGVDAAVLVPVFFKNDEAHMLFTKRTHKVEHHKGQISFPGGRRDDTDRDLEQTALRETEEEVGIRPADIQVLGQTDCFLTNTHYMVTPFVGYYDYPYAYEVNHDEIERLIEVPLLHLFEDDIFEVKSHTSAGYTWKLHYYYFEEEIIWGVTGFLLSNFLSIAFDLPRFSLEP